MNIWQIVAIATGTVVLVILAGFAFSAFKNRKETPISPLLILAMGLNATGIVFSSDRLLGYSLLGAGIVIAVIEMIRLTRKRGP